MSLESRFRPSLVASAITVTAAFGLSACGSSPDDGSTESGAPESSSSEGAPITDEMIDATELSGEPLAVEEGEGDGTVEVPEHDGPLVVKFENTADHEGWFISGESDTDQSLESPSTDETLITLLDQFSYEGEQQEISTEIELVSMNPTPYRISFYPLDSVPVVEDAQGVEATGPGIFRWKLEQDNNYELAMDDDLGYASTAWGLDSVKPEILWPRVSGGGEEVLAGEYLVFVEHEPEQSWSYEPITEDAMESFSQEQNASTLE